MEAEGEAAKLMVIAHLRPMLQLVLRRKGQAVWEWVVAALNDMDLGELRVFLDNEAALLDWIGRLRGRPEMQVSISCVQTATDAPSYAIGAKGSGKHLVEGPFAGAFAIPMPSVSSASSVGGGEDGTASGNVRTPVATNQAQEGAATTAATTPPPKPGPKGPDAVDELYSSYDKLTVKQKAAKKKKGQVRQSTTYCSPQRLSISPLPQPQQPLFSTHART